MGKIPKQRRAAEPLRPHEVELHVSLSDEYTSSIRSLALDMAIRQDMDLAKADDMRLVVGEAYETVVADADPAAELVCRLLMSPSKMEFSATATLSAGHRDGIGRDDLTILRAFSDFLDVWTTRDGDRRLLHLQLTMSAN